MNTPVNNCNPQSEDIIDEVLGDIDSVPFFAVLLTVLKEDVESSCAILLIHLVAVAVNQALLVLLWEHEVSVCIVNCEKLVSSAISFNPLVVELLKELNAPKSKETDSKYNNDDNEIKAEPLCFYGSRSS